MPQPKLNAVYTSPRMKRRYEVWFLRCGLADGSGAWWFRYLIMNLGRGTAASAPGTMPAQVRATWFPHDGEPRSFIQGFPIDQLDLSQRGALPFHCRIAQSGIEEGKCWGNLLVDGRTISWKLRITSHFGVTLSDKGWIGFSRSPHSDATFSGEILFDGRRFAGDPLGHGVQGHNCGYRHRSYWRWMHASFVNPAAGTSTLEALVYDMPLGMVFRNVVVWHKGSATILRKVKELAIVRESDRLRWLFTGLRPDGSQVEAEIEGLAPAIHRLPYTRTDGVTTFPVSNASTARATVHIKNGGAIETLHTDSGAVLEFGGA